MSAPSKSDNKQCTPCQRLGLKPFTKQNILYYYAPLHGLASYGGLSINVMNPALITKFFPQRDITNFLLIHTMVGTSLYLYSRKHLQSVEPKKRVAYCILGSAFFGLGSVLMWAILRSSVPKNPALATGLGIASAYAVARLSYDYFEHVDKNTK